MLKRTLSTLFCAVAGVAAIGVPAAAAEDPPPAAGTTTSATTAAARGEKGAARCAPALGFVAGIVTAIEPPEIVIEVKRAGALGAELVGGELAVVVAQRTKFFKKGGPARPGVVKIGDRIAVRVLKCRGDKLSAEQMRAAIVVDHGPGAAGDAGVATEQAVETEPTATTVAEIGRPVRPDAGGRGRGAGQGQATGKAGPAAQGGRAKRGAGQSDSQGAARTTRTTRTADGDGALAENTPPAAGGKRPGQGAGQAPRAGNGNGRRTAPGRAANG